MNFQSMLLTIVSVAVFSSKGQLQMDGACPEYAVVQNFEISRYTGGWYEIYSYPTTLTELCTYVNSTLDSNNVVLNRADYLYSNGKFIKDTGFFYFHIRSKAYLSYPNSDIIEGKFNLSYSGKPPLDVNYFILDTDYDNYALVWNCWDYVGDSFSKHQAWVLSRENTINPTVLDKVNEGIDKYFDRSNLHGRVEIC